LIVGAVVLVCTSIYTSHCNTSGVTSNILFDFVFLNLPLLSKVQFSISIFGYNHSAVLRGKNVLSKSAYKSANLSKAKSLFVIHVLTLFWLASLCTSVWKAVCCGSQMMFCISIQTYIAMSLYNLSIKLNIAGLGQFPLICSKFQANCQSKLNISLSYEKLLQSKVSQFQIANTCWLLLFIASINVSLKLLSSELNIISLSHNHTPQQE
jgi:hypothetical protein